MVWYGYYPWRVTVYTGMGAVWENPTCELPVVLCHHSPRRISLTFGQHPLYSVSDPYICATTLYGPCYHFHPQHSLHPPFASSRHLLTPEPSHPSHIIGSFVTGTAIMSARQEARPNSVVPPLLRQAMECGRN